jgi:hypothetical protein
MHARAAWVARPAAGEAGDSPIQRSVVCPAGLTGSLPPLAVPFSVPGIAVAQAVSGKRLLELFRRPARFTGRLKRECPAGSGPGAGRGLPGGPPAPGSWRAGGAQVRSRASPGWPGQARPPQPCIHPLILVHSAVSVWSGVVGPWSHAVQVHGHLHTPFSFPQQLRIGCMRAGTPPPPAGDFSPGLSRLEEGPKLLWPAGPAGPGLQPGSRGGSSSIGRTQAPHGPGSSATAPRQHPGPHQQARRGCGATPRV